MIEPGRLKQIVKNDYRLIAENSGSCCCSPCETEMYDNESYRAFGGYVAESDMGLSCGCPAPVAGIQPGQTVVDLGCGGGLDAFIAAGITGPSGRVIGIDFTPAMIEKANQNRLKHKIDQTEFILSDIENLALESEIADVVISNCVLNLVPDKLIAFREIRRILKPGGYFCISDMATDRPWPDSFKNNMKLYSACLTGALCENEFIKVIQDAGFQAPEILSRKAVSLPGAATGAAESKKDTIPVVFSLTLKAFRKN